MSRYSGKCDLRDHISGCAGWYDKDGNPVKFGDPGVGCYYSDEWQDFLAFKKQTGGVLHQHKKITLTPWNHEDVKKLCPNFDYQEHVKIVPDKRNKSGQREEKYLTYTYYNKEYTLRELNKKGIWITVDIHFDTLLDLIPYYPYIVSAACAGTVYISQQSFVDDELEDHLDGGWYSDSWQHYKKELQDHYREVVLKYYNPAGREVEEELEFKPTEDGKVVAATKYPIDDNFEPEWVTELSHWTKPKVYDSCHIEMSLEDYNRYLGPKVKVKYVKEKKDKDN